MASINDLATAATIASSAVALQSSPSRAAGQSTTTPPRSPSPRPGTASASGPAVETELAQLQRFVKGDGDAGAPEDGDSITVATGAPPASVLVAPQVEPQNAAPVPAPATAETGSDGDAGKEAEEEIGPDQQLAAEDAMDGIEKDEAPRPPVRGAFVVFEGMDRAGKTTQAKLLQQRCIESGREVRFMRFPDRTTLIGRMIDSYLKGETEVEDHVIHLLFSANRWEAVKKIKAELEAGHTIICDRFYHSGIVYSAAKELKNLSLSWAKAPEVGLPRPDVVLFLDLEEEVARERGGWGGEVYEKGEMQRRVRDLFWSLSMGDLGSNSSSNAKGPRRGEAERLGNGSSRGKDGATTGNEEGEFRQEEEDIQIVDADLDVESLSERVWELVLPRLEAVERGEVGRTVRTVR